MHFAASYVECRVVGGQEMSCARPRRGLHMHVLLLGAVAQPAVRPPALTPPMLSGLVHPSL